MKRLYFDFEVSPNTCLVWRTGRKLTVNPESIIAERKIISVAWKWQGESKIHSLAWDKNQDDRTLLIAFSKVIDQADEAIAYFGDSYDAPFFRTRCLIHGIRINPTIKIVDPLKWVRGKYFFNSGKLDYVAQVLGVGKKIDTNFQLWRDIVLNKCPIALEKMLRYNRQDIRILEGVWKILSDSMSAQTHAGVSQGKPRWTCAKCGSEDVRKSKTRITAVGAKQHQMTCLDCHGYYTVSEKVHKEYLSR